MSIISEIANVVCEQGYKAQDDMILLIPNQLYDDLIAEVNLYGISPLITRCDIRNIQDGIYLCGYPAIFRACDEIMLVRDDR